MESAQKLNQQDVGVGCDCSENNLLNGELESYEFFLISLTLASNSTDSYSYRMA
ncbi:MAG: hypothetical protein ACP5RH_12715 [Leptodesmis sp.]|uniref:hypothetical protein n=1 Tax=Leptodesmis sp. TaxID=3100501 RepID=UPI003D0A70A6